MAVDRSPGTVATAAQVRWLREIGPVELDEVHDEALWREAERTDHGSPGNLGPTLPHPPALKVTGGPTRGATCTLAPTWAIWTTLEPMMTSTTVSRVGTAGRAALAFATLVAAADGARADVVREEPNEETVAASEVIALATVEAVEGKGPFTNGSPPALVFAVTKAIKGTKVGEKLRVARWMDADATTCARKGMPVPEAECKLLDQQRREAPVAAPVPGSRHLLFLERDASGLKPHFNAWHRRITFADPSGRQATLVSGLVAFTFDAPRALPGIASGRPVVLRGALTNVSAAKASFDPGQIVLEGQLAGRPQKPVSARVASAGGAAVITLAPRERREVAWDLTKLFPVTLAYPGTYTLRLELPARCTQGASVYQHLDFTIDGTPTLAVSVEASPVVFVARAGQQVPQAGGRIDVVLNDRQMLKTDGSEAAVPLMMPWPAPRIALPHEGDWVIVCAAGDDLRCAVPRTPARLAEVKQIISGR
jgi:hypothetical protein